MGVELIVWIENFGRVTGRILTKTAQYFNQNQIYRVAKRGTVPIQFFEQS